MTQTERALKPVAQDFEETVRFAGTQRDRIRDIAGRMKSENIKNVWLVGCGGSHYAQSAAQYVLSRRGQNVVSFRMNANEFNHARPKMAGPHSLVIVGSHSGTTPETLDAIETARSLGVKTVVGMTRSPDSELGKRVDEAFTYESKHTVWEPKQVYFGLFAHELLAAYGDESQSELEDAAAGYLALPEALRTAIEENESQSAEIASAFAQEPVTYVLGSGPNEDVARCLAMCYLQEMQWLHAAAFNAGEFFHGAFEMVTEEMPLILLLGEDSSRPMAERASRFLGRYSKRTFEIDSKKFSLPGVPEAARSEVAPIALGTIVSRLAQHYEAVTGHDLDTRRYMFKVKY